jgi:hypothetical protein
MPLKNVNYENTVIYKIVCNDLTITDLYIGSTTNFTKRKGQHKFHCTSEKSKSQNYKIYQTIRENGGWENWSMIEIEKYACNDGNEARARERYYYDLFNSNLNTSRPFITIDEKKESNIILKRISSPIYYQNNKEKIYNKIKESNLKNRDIISIKTKQYAIENKQKIKDNQNQIIVCECGLEMKKICSYSHLKTKKHAKLLSQKKAIV